MALKLVLFISLLFLHTACVAPAKLDVPAGRKNANVDQAKSTLEGLVTTVAGSGSSSIVDGIGLAANINSVTAMVFHPTKKVFYFADYHESLYGGFIRTFNPNTLQVTTIAGGNNMDNLEGVGSAARMGPIGGMAIDSEGNIYFTDFVNHNIKKLNVETLQVSIFAGTGVAGFANGARLSAQFDEPFAIAIDSADNIYVGDYNNYVIRVIRTNGTVLTHVGKQGDAGIVDASAYDAKFSEIRFMLVDKQDTLHISDINNYRVINPATYTTTMAGDSSGSSGYVDDIGTDALFTKPYGLALSLDGNYVYIADSETYTLRRFDIESSEVTTFLGEQGDSQALDGDADTARFLLPRVLVFDDKGNLYVGENRVIRKIE
jgi:DNA-binding beta-propeller fold protein YncE